jgi:hypothetical protein
MQQVDFKQLSIEPKRERPPTIQLPGVNQMYESEQKEYIDGYSSMRGDKLYRYP